jgi:hypothetical protein
MFTFSFPPFTTLHTSFPIFLTTTTLPATIHSFHSPSLSASFITGLPSSFSVFLQLSLPLPFSLPFPFSFSISRELLLSLPFPLLLPLLFTLPITGSFHFSSVPLPRSCCALIADNSSATLVGSWDVSIWATSNEFVTL